MSNDVRSRLQRMASKLAGGAAVPAGAGKPKKVRKPAKGPGPGLRRHGKSVSAEPAQTPPSNVTHLSVVPRPKGVVITDGALARARQKTRRRDRAQEAAAMFRPAEFPKGVVPAEAKMAMDDALSSVIGWASSSYFNNQWWEGQQFLGYAYLAELSQRPEYRRMCGRLAEECTREWIEMGAEGDPSNGYDNPVADALYDKARAARIKVIKDELDKLGMQQACKDLVEKDANFGRAHLYLDFGDRRDEVEQRVSIGSGCDKISEVKVGKDHPLVGIKVVEPMWCYPSNYNSTDPLAPDWYNPDRWFVMGREVHKTRLIPFVTRPVPDMLKPAYGFGGLSLIQMAKPYVDNWITTRQSVADLIKSFSTMVLHSNLQTVLQDDGASLFKRIDFFNEARDNRGLMVVAKEEENLTNVTTPLGTLDALQAQSQEQMSAVSGIPLVILLGITPKGLNASSEGEIRVFYDLIRSFQNTCLRPIIKTVIDFIQLSKFGSIDPDINFKFVPLWSLDEKAKAEVDKIEAETDQIRIDAGVLHPEEARQRLAGDPNSPYASIDVNDVPEPPEDPLGGGGDPFGGGGGNGPAGPGEPAGSGGGGAEDALSTLVSGLRLALDAWEEGKHPRDPDGKFTDGAGGSSGSAPEGGKKPAAKAAPSPQAAASATWGKAKVQLKDLKKVSGQKGSNPGGVYKDKYGNEYYAKHLKSPEHVTNELTAASLYKLAGSNTLDYVPISDDKNTVATKLAKLDKANVKDLTAKEKNQARKDFVVHAWLANWDAAGTGGDNQGIKGGKVTTLDVGGALEFRAQGSPKGAAFGDQVTELQSMIDPSKSPDAAALFGGMSADEMAEAAKKVTSLSDDQIRATVQAAGGSDALADKLIKRRDHIAAVFEQKPGGKEEAFSDEAFESLHPRGPGGKFQKKAGGESPAPGNAAAVEEAQGKLMEAVVDGADWETAKTLLDEKDLAALEEVGGAQETFAEMVSQHVTNELTGAKASKMTDQELAAAVAADPAEKPKPGEMKIGETPEPGKKTAFGGLFKTGATKTEAYNNTVNGVLAKPANAGSSYRQMLTHLIKEAKAHGYEDKVPALTTKLGEAYKNAGWKAHADAETATDPKKKDELQKIAKGAFQKAHELGVPVSAGGGNTSPKEQEEAPPLGPVPDFVKKATAPSAAPAPAAPSMPATGTPELNKKLNAIEDGAGTDAFKAISKLKEIIKAGGTPEQLIANLTDDQAEAIVNHGGISKQWGMWKEKYQQDGVIPKSGAAPAPTTPAADPNAAKASAAKLAQSMKAKFAENTKTKTNMTPLDTAKQMVKAAVQVGATLEMAKGQMTQAGIEAMNKQYGSLEKAYQKAQEYDASAKQAQAQQEAAQAAEQIASKNLAEATIKSMQTPEMQEHYDVLKGIGVSGNYLVEYAQKKLAGSGLEGKISPQEAAYIGAYSSSHYVGVNQQLRSGVMTESQYKFASALNKALDKLPPHVGMTTRGANLTPQQLALYQPGMIIEERAFTSTGKGFKFSGNTTFEIHGKNGRDISKLSGVPNEAEVLFKSGSRFKVKSKTGNKIVLEEVDF